MLSLGVGLTLGLAGSLAITRVLKSELVQVSPTDPITLVVASAVFGHRRESRHRFIQPLARNAQASEPEAPKATKPAKAARPAKKAKPAKKAGLGQLCTRIFTPTRCL
jgi:hypothetical protein